MSSKIILNHIKICEFDNFGILFWLQLDEQTDILETIIFGCIIYIIHTVIAYICIGKVA